MQNLIDTYGRTRRLTDDERDLLRPLLAAHLGADAIGKIN